MLKFAAPLIGEEEKEAVLLAMSGDRLTEGPKVEEFEHRFGEKFGGYAVAVSSCTAALYIAGKLLPPQTLTVPAMTHPATALAMVDHKIVFEDHHNTDVSVDFLGMDQPKGKIEDAATALHLKEYGMLACFSFYPAKQMTTGEGGMLLCKDRRDAAEAKKIRAFGKPEFDCFGLNFRMSEIAAAIGVEQLLKLDDFIKRREDNENVLRECLKDFELIGDNYALSIITPHRDRIRLSLLKQGVETSAYYPIPVPHTKYFGEDKCYPQAERISSQSVTLSVGPHLTQNDMKFVGTLARELLWLAEEDLSATT